MTLKLKQRQPKDHPPKALKTYKGLIFTLWFSMKAIALTGLLSVNANKLLQATAEAFGI